MLILKSAGPLLIALLGTILVSSCAIGGGGGDEEGVDATPLPDFFQTIEPETPTLGATNGQATPGPRTTQTPVALTLDDARNLVWSYLGRCLALDPEQLDANQVRGNWFVKATAGVAPLAYELWRVDAGTGSIDPQDPLGREVDSYVKSRCEPNLLPALFVPTPTPTIAPTNTPAPTPTPVVQRGEQARNLVWAYLGTCADLFVAQLEPFQVRDDWFVKSSGISPVQYGLWKVDSPSGAVDPRDPLARRWESYIQSDCDQDVFVNLFPPTPTPVPTPTPTTTRVPPRRQLPLPYQLPPTRLFPVPPPP